MVQSQWPGDHQIDQSSATRSQLKPAAVENRWSTSMHGCFSWNIQKFWLLLEPYHGKTPNIGCGPGAELSKNWKHIDQYPCYYHYIRSLYDMCVCTKMVGVYNYCVYIYIYNYNNYNYNYNNNDNNNNFNSSNKNSNNNNTIYIIIYIYVARNSVGRIYII